MTVTRDIGEIDGPLLICGGAYSNLEALRALLAEAARRRIPDQAIIHTGDAVAYCADAHAVCAELEARAIRAIKGNVEAQLAEGADDCGCGFEDGSECDLLSRQWYGHAGREITAEQRQWMADLPDHLAFSMNGRRFQVVHGAPSAVSRFQFASLDDAAFAAELDLTSADCVIAGHTGLPFTRRIGERIWHNSGALGMPANDGTARVWTSVIAPVGGAISFTHVPLDYDHAMAAAKMRTRGLPEAYAAALETGLWPDTGILGEEERAETGALLAPVDVLWLRSAQSAA